MFKTELFANTKQVFLEAIPVLGLFPEEDAGRHPQWQTFEWTQLEVAEESNQGSFVEGDPVLDQLDEGSLGDKLLLEKHLFS